MTCCETSICPNKLSTTRGSVSSPCLLTHSSLRGLAFDDKKSVHKSVGCRSRRAKRYRELPLQLRRQRIIAGGYRGQRSSKAIEPLITHGEDCIGDEHAHGATQARLSERAKNGGIAHAAKERDEESPDSGVDDREEDTPGDEYPRRELQHDDPEEPPNGAQQQIHSLAFQGIDDNTSDGSDAGRL